MGTPVGEPVGTPVGEPVETLGRASLVTEGYKQSYMPDVEMQAN